MTVDELRPVSTEPICPRPSFLTGVVGQSQLSVGPGGITVSASRLAKSVANFSYTRTSVSRLPYVKKNGLVGTGLDQGQIGRVQPICPELPLLDLPKYQDPPLNKGLASA